MVKIGLVPLLGMAAILPAPGADPLIAGMVSATMAVTATVEESCHLAARPLVFGTVRADSGSADAQSSVVLACTPEASYVVTMDAGRYGAGGARRMADTAGSRFVAYEIYSDAARTKRWAASPANAVSAVIPAGGRVELDVYARLAATDTPAGAYQDTITVTVAF